MATLSALGSLRICDFTGQLAGAGATKLLAAFGAEVIRIEDPVRQGRWDILRGTQPFVGENRGIEAGGSFNNHNAGKLGITLNLRTETGKQVLRELVEVSDAVTENFAAGVMDRLGFGYEELRTIKPSIVYVSNNGFGATGPYRLFKSWGPIAQAVSGLTHQSGLPGQPPAGWGYSFMDHTGAYFMAIATLMGLLHQRKTGEGQWIDLACAEAAGGLHGATTLDYTVNGRPTRREGALNSNRSTSPAMAPHGVFPCAGDDRWVAIAVRHDADWLALAEVVDEPWAAEPPWERLAGRLEAEDELEEHLSRWTATQAPQAVADRLVAAGVPAAPVLRPSERIEADSRTASLWLEREHTALGTTRVEGLPLRLSATDWEVPHAAPCLGEHNRYVLCDVLGYSADDLERLEAKGVV